MEELIAKTEDISWQSFKSVKEKNRYLLKNKHLCDVTFVVGEKAEEISAHKLILASHSPVFETILYNDSLPKNDHISIPDIEPHIFHLLLACIYSKASPETVTEALLLYSVADKYRLTTIMKGIESYIKANLNVKNLLNVFEFAKSRNNKHLIECSSQYWRENTGDILSGDNFNKDISISTIEELFEMDELNITDEIELVEAFIDYYETHKYNTLKDYDVWRVLSKIRLLSISPKDIFNCKGLESLMPENEYCTLLKNLISMDLGQVPRHICNNGIRRGAQSYEIQITNYSPKTVYSDCEFENITARVLFERNTLVVGFTLEPFCYDISISFDCSDYSESFKTSKVLDEIEIKLKTPVFIKQSTWVAITLEFKNPKPTAEPSVKSGWSSSDNGTFIFSDSDYIAFRSIEYLL